MTIELAQKIENSYLARDVRPKLDVLERKYHFTVNELIASGVRVNEVIRALWRYVSSTSVGFDIKYDYLWTDENPPTQNRIYGR